jgi:hypothetical protein
MCLFALMCIFAWKLWTNKYGKSIFVFPLRPVAAKIELCLWCLQIIISDVILLCLKLVLYAQINYIETCSSFIQRTSELTRCTLLHLQIFATPKDHRKAKPFHDHVFVFSIVDDHIWFRNYQVMYCSVWILILISFHFLKPIKLLASCHHLNFSKW